MSEWHEALKEAELAPGQAKSLTLEGQALLLVHAEGGWKAYKDHCSHAQVSLGDQALDAGSLTCPRHGARFDAASGEALSLPAVRPLAGLPLKAEAGVIYVQL
jgi:3-phenylpropionate/trans-cinnamate dioxygenase ferredoxin subunit